MRPAIISELLPPEGLRRFYRWTVRIEDVDTETVVFFVTGWSFRVGKAVDRICAAIDAAEAEVHEIEHDGLAFS